MGSQINRRTFLDFLGKGTAGLVISSRMAERLLIVPVAEEIVGIAPSGKDTVVLAKGLKSKLLVSWGEAISSKDTFGFNNDYIAFLPGSNDEALLWVNHEYVDPLFVSNYRGLKERTLEMIITEQYNVGGTLIKIRKNKKGHWNMVADDPMNKRITGTTKIPFNWDEPIAGSDHAIGTLANCSGGVTPWGSILTCEENYDMFYGERNLKTGEVNTNESSLGWQEFLNYPPEHYGWVVEVEPNSGKAQKHVALGRFAHECATVAELEDGRVVVYMGDDKANQCLYKFVGSVPASLSEGTLYVANLGTGNWIPIDWETSEVLQKKFSNQTEVLIRLRQAARYLGGTPLDRPEDIEIDPVSGHILVALTNNTSVKNYFGSILQINEEDGKHDALTFRPDAFLTGGEETGFACPDNMAFDAIGNLWFTSDVSTTSMHRDPYKAFKNNALFLVMREGSQAGQVLQMASAPVGAEFTGPQFSDDWKTLFLSVQHPGEDSLQLSELTSHWPDGGVSIPRPGVITISGPLLDEIQGLV
ncbi:MAG: alkaline phosphatase [Bacteroidetes bacterium]|nr:MAG: alkaline phosphatase [Bacteroidota bacterium]